MDLEGWFCWAEMWYKGNEGSILQQSHVQKLRSNEWKTQESLMKGSRKAWFHGCHGNVLFIWYKIAK